MTKKELQSRIYNSVKDAPIIGEQESADKHCVKYTTLMRILYGNEGKIGQIEEGRISVYGWAKKNNLSDCIGLAYAIANLNVNKVNFKGRMIRMCDDNPYVSNSGKINNTEMALRIGISRQLLNHKVRKYNIPNEVIRGVRYFDKDINISQYIN